MERNQWTGRNGPVARELLDAATELNKTPRKAWAPEQDATLRTLWDAGLSGTAIAHELQTTRGAVLGRVHRLDLPPRSTLISFRNHSNPRGRPSDRPLAISIFELTTASCRYPLYRLARRDQYGIVLFCGCPIDDERCSWCERHRALCVDRERTAR